MKTKFRSQCRRFSPLAIALAASLASGCAAYRLGNTLPPDWKTVCVLPAANRSTQPQLEFPVTTALVQEFQRDGSLRVLTEAEADVLLETTIVKYALTPVSYSRERTQRPQDYRIEMLADVVVKSRADGSVLRKIEGIEGKTTFTVSSGDLSADERSALPDAARYLAHNVVREVVEAW